MDVTFGVDWGFVSAVGLFLAGGNRLVLLCVDFAGASLAVAAVGLAIAAFLAGRFRATADAMAEDARLAVSATAGTFAADFFVDARLTGGLVDDFSCFVLLTTSPEVLAIQTSERQRDGFGRLIEPACTRQL